MSNIPKGIPIARVFVYRESKPKEVKNDPTKVALANKPQPLPQHDLSKIKPGMSLDEIPWYCVIGFGEDLPSKVNYEGEEESRWRDPKGWQLVSARINQTRIWSCSTATFQIARPVDRSNQNYSKATKSNGSGVTGPEVYAPPVRPEDIIVVEMGYTDSMISTKCSAEAVFYGIVDTVKERGGSGENDGISCTIVARDTMRYLVDNKIRGQILDWGKVTQDPTLQSNRAFLIRDLIYRGAAINYVKWKKDPTNTNNFLYEKSVGTDTEPGHIGKFKEAERPTDGNPSTVNADKDFIIQEKFGKDNSYVKIGKIEASLRKDLPAAAGDNTTPPSLILMDRFPLDVIKHFSLVETAPRELWADRRTGEIHWMFRRTDARRLYGGGKTNKAKNADQLTESRQYFYRTPSDKANIISYTAEWTTIGSITHFSVTNSQAFNSTGTRGTKEIYAESPTGLFDDPHAFDKDGNPKKLRRFTRNRYVYDESTLENTLAEEIAIALFTVWGKDIETGMVHVPGDPTLEIGEAIQLFNTGLFGRRYSPGIKADTGSDQPNQSGPEGVYRVEAVNHLFAAGGAQKGFTTVFIFGPCDPPLGTAESKRLIEDDDDLKAFKIIEA